MAEPNNTPMPASTPVPGATPRSASPVPGLAPTEAASANGGAAAGRTIVLHIGDEVRYNAATYAEFAGRFEVVRPATPELQRPEFARGLREGRWGAFEAVFRPFWGSGGEMGRWDDELIGLLPASCRVFASAGAGFDWADTEALGEKGIIYCNSGLAAAEAVADFAVAMVISTFRNLPWCMGAATAPMSSTDEAHSLFNACHALATGASRNLRGHALGLIGLGNIGQHLAAKLGSRAFGMRVHYFDVVRKSAAVEADLGATFHDSIEALLRVSDCTVLCTPASPDGRPLITRQVLKAAKKGARFVNIARGSLVDEDALADALEDGSLAAAALDVHAAEPNIHPRLLRLATVLPPAARGTLDEGTPGRVMLTCHNAGGTVDTHIGFEELSMRNIMAVLSGQEPLTPVNMHYLKHRD